MKKIDDSTLLSIIDSQISNSIGTYGTEEIHDKATALDYYLGDESLIDAEDGESSIITREVLENVERELGQQLKVFTSGEKVVQFDPQSEEDEDAAEQETDYVNYIFHKENDGFKITHDWIKSALIERNAYVKVWIEEDEDIEFQTYSGLNDLELTQVLEQEGAEPVEHDAYFVNIDGERMPDEMQDDPAMMGMIAMHDIKVKVTSKEKRIKIMAVPGEEIGVAKSHYQLSLKDCPFVYHKPQGITASELIESGFDKDLVETLPTFNNYTNELGVARNDGRDATYQTADESTREIEVYECYIRMDYDGDGIAELRKVTKAGEIILENEECDFIPFATLCPIPMPHKHEGLSYADMIMDLQDISTVLHQQIFTNLYMTNSPEREVVEGEVNIDDLLTSKSGSLKRVKRPGMIRDLTVPFTAGASMPMLETIKQIISNRVGSTKNLDPNILAQTTGMAYAIADGNDSAFSEKLARIFAETGFKELFKMIHELAIKHIDKQKVIRLRNKYVPINPTEWKHRTDMSIVVGLGTGNRDAEVGKLMQLAAEQKEHLMEGSPLVTLKNLYNTYAKVIERSGLKEPSIYFTDPESDEAKQKAQQDAQNKQQPPNQLAEAEQVKGQFAIQKAQMEVQFKGQLEQFKQQAEHDKQMLKLQLDDRARALDRESKEAIEIMKAEVQAIVAGYKVDIGKPGIGAEISQDEVLENG